jgi:hypothetical protein
MTKPTLLPSPDWVMANQQDRIDEEGCGPVFAAAQWPLVRKRKHRHKM